MFGKLDALRGACPVWKGGFGNLPLKGGKALGSYLTVIFTSKAQRQRKG
jgi:hypothetical protein